MSAIPDSRVHAAADYLDDAVDKVERDSLAGLFVGESDYTEKRDNGRQIKATYGEMLGNAVQRGFNQGSDWVIRLASGSGASELTPANGELAATLKRWCGGVGRFALEMSARAIDGLDHYYDERWRADNPVTEPDVPDLEIIYPAEDQ